MSISYTIKKEGISDLIVLPPDKNQEIETSEIKAIILGKIRATMKPNSVLDF